MKRLVIYALGTLLALLLLLAGALGWLLATHSGNQLLLRQIPGLEVEEFDGSLLGNWSAARLHWHDQNTSLTLLQAQMSLQLSCLQQRRLCVQQLSASELIVDLADSQQPTEQPAKDFELPEINLPFALELQQLSLGALRLNGQQLLQDIALQASVEQTQLSVQNLQLAYQQHRLQASGELSMQQDWPLQFKLLLSSQLEGLSQSLDASLNIGGSLRNSELELSMHSLYGQLQAQAQIKLEQAISWQAQLTASNFNPVHFVPELPGSISGQLNTSGSWQQQLELQAQAQLDGQLRGEELKLELQASGQGQQWQLQQLNASLGASSLHANARLGQKLEGQLDLQLPELQQLVAQAQGSLSAAIQLDGSLQQPQLQLRLNAEGLQYQEQHIGKLNLGFNGGLHQQQLDLELDGQAQLSASLHGKLDLLRLRWQGQLTRLHSGIEGQRLHLGAPMQIDYQHQPQRLELGTHCLLTEQGAQLCARDSVQLLPRLQLAYQLVDFPLYALHTWLPPELELQGKLNGGISLQQQADAIFGLIDLDAGQGQLLYNQQGQEYQFGWQQLQLHSQLDEQTVAAKLLLTGAQTGKLQLELALDPTKDSKPLSGSFNLQQVQLEPLKPMLAQVEQLRGELVGSGQISGTLLQPLLDGQFELSNAAIAGERLPIDMQDLWLKVRLAQSMARLEGGWRSGKQGTASINGRIDWQDQLQVAVNFIASQLPILVPPYADLLLAADVQLGYNERGLLLSGLLEVPSGQIKVPELPAQAVRISSDAQVIGREPVEPSLPLALDLQIKVGQERLYFSGFGLTALVVGDMHMSDSLNGRGILELKEGRYRAYGQRLQLRRARLVFSGPVTQPYIDIEAVRVTGDVTAGLRLSGLAEQPQTEIFSQPAMSQEQALSWLLLGRPLEGGGDDGNMMRQAALALGMLGTTPIANRMADAFGIKEFQLDTEGSGMQTSVMATGRLTDKLSLGYGVGVFEPGGIIQLRYQLTKRLYVEAASSMANSLDIFYRRSF